jgi:hypothetical protein
LSNYQTKLIVLILPDPVLEFLDTTDILDSQLECLRQAASTSSASECGTINERGDHAASPAGAHMGASLTSEVVLNNESSPPEPLNHATSPAGVQTSTDASPNSEVVPNSESSPPEPIFSPRTIARMLLIAQMALVDITDIELLKQFLGIKYPMFSGDCVKTLPTRLLEASDFSEGEVTTCAICLESKNEGDEVRVLPCGHWLDDECAKVWLVKGSSTCPLCRAAVRT